MQFIEKYGGYYVNKKYPDSARDKVIYLTFDVGYENGNVERILNVLRDEGVSSAFFVLENFIVKNPNLIMRMVNEGHLVCNHTATHKNITKFSSREELKAELERLENLYFDVTGLKMQRFFRPPEGKFDQRTLAYLNELGYKTVFWSVAYADWDNNNQPSSNFAKEKIYSNLHNGEIMLLHPTSKTNADILKEVIAELKSRGYRFGTLDEL
jgi:peptidoglycan-N-acetylmuramic acid deacetylase